SLNDSKPISITPYLDVVYRHRRSALSVLTFGLFTTLFLVIMLPDTVRSTAVIAIEPAQVPSDYLSLGTGSNRATTNVGDQLEALAHNAFNKQRLTELIETYGLYGYHPGGSLDAFLTLFESHIDLVVPQDAITYERTISQSGTPDILKVS